MAMQIAKSIPMMVKYVRTNFGKTTEIPDRAMRAQELSTCKEKCWYEGVTGNDEGTKA